MHAALAQLRHMLQQYETQLMAARRLARYRRARRLAEGDEPATDPRVRRRAIVERVAQELYESILFTGTENPVVDVIRKRLGDTVGGGVRFTYPPGEEKVRIMREDEAGLRPLTEDERLRALHYLWGITLKAVDESTI